MRLCDLCGRETTDLTPLRDEYRTTKVRETCQDCTKRLDAVLARTAERLDRERRVALARAVREEMRAVAGAPTPEEGNA